MGQQASMNKGGSAQPAAYAGSSGKGGAMQAPSYGGGYGGGGSMYGSGPGYQPSYYDPTFGQPGRGNDFLSTLPPYGASGGGKGGYVQPGLAQTGMYQAAPAGMGNVNGYGNAPAGIGFGQGNGMSSPVGTLQLPSGPFLPTTSRPTVQPQPVSTPTASAAALGNALRSGVRQAQPVSRSSSYSPEILAWMRAQLAKGAGADNEWVGVDDPGRPLDISWGQLKAALGQG